jgi:MFS family permease
MALLQATEKHDPFAALRIRQFRFFILSRFFITLAIQIQTVVVTWKLYEITGDVLSLGLIGLAEAIPALSVALYAGYVVDNNDRRKIALLSLGLLLLCSALLLVVMIVSPPQMATYMYSIIFLTGIARGFMAPSYFSLLAQLVPRHLYSNSSTWNSTSWQIGAVAGPALGGIIYAFAGMRFTLMLVLVLSLAALYAVWCIKSNGVPEHARREGMLKSLGEGIRFVFSNKIILGALSLDLFAVLFGGAVALLPAFAKDVLKLGPEGLGFLRAAPSVGAFITMIGLAYYPPAKRAGYSLLVCVAGFGICMILFALSENFIFSLFILALSGAFDSVSVVIRSTILQFMTPEHMRGRVSAVNTMFIGSSNELGAFESGFMARLMGLVPSVIFGGCMTLGVVIFTGWKAPSLRRFSMAEVK